MHNLRKSILIGLTVLGMSTATAGFAQTDAAQGRHGNAATQEQRAAKMAEFEAKRTARLHDELMITPAQENAFRTYVAAMKPQHQQARGEHTRFEELTTPQRMEKMIAMQKQRTVEMEARLPALNAFYAVLTPAQKKVFDQRGMHHRGHDGHGWGGRQG